MKKYELWRSTEDGLVDDFFESGKGDETHYQLLEPGTRLIWSCEADSWDEAQQKRYDSIDWGLYRPIGSDGEQ